MTQPTVTEVLRAFSGFDKVSLAVLDKAAARGTTVHAICAEIAQGTWIPDDFTREDLRGYVRSFLKWKEYQVNKFLVIEKRYYNECLGYSGKIDFLIEGSDKKKYLVDLKTSHSPNKTYPVQMAAYTDLLRRDGIQTEAALIIYLDKEGGFPEIHYLDDLSEEWDIFKCALECYVYFKKPSIAKKDLV